MVLLENFLHFQRASLKICGVTSLEDGEKLTSMGVEALGVNFWPQSKRYVSAIDAAWLGSLAGKILRVGVFVNQPPEQARELYAKGLLDVVQLHGDEKMKDVAIFQAEGIPFFKALGVAVREDFSRAVDYGATAILLDAFAPGAYGGTGRVFDWELAVEFKDAFPDIPLILAGGILPENVACAISQVSPAAVDIASGAESSPGVKDFRKIRAYLAALQR